MRFAPLMRRRISYTEFIETKRLNRLDGLRAVSIALVLTVHSGVPALASLNGYTGVTVFFVISGFLITTLLLREEKAFGRIDLGGFYLRRIFRILPLYYAAVALFTLGAALGLAATSADYLPRMVYFLTYTNELAPSGVFGHSWSLGVEEKYYLVWPVLVFTLPFTVRHRRVIGLGLLVATCILGLLGPWRYLGLYAPILSGCVLAMVLNDRRGFNAASWLARPVPGLFALILALVAVARSTDSHLQVTVGLAVMAAFPVLLLGPSQVTGWLGHRWMVYLGTRSYAVYLFHPLVGSAVKYVASPGTTVAGSVAYFSLSAVGSVALAEVLYRLVEQPLIKLGRRMYAGRTGNVR